MEVWFAAQKGAHLARLRGQVSALLRDTADPAWVRESYASYTAEHVTTDGYWVSILTQDFESLTAAPSGLRHFKYCPHLIRDKLLLSLSGCPVALPAMRVTGISTAPNPRRMLADVNPDAGQLYTMSEQDHEAYQGSLDMMADVVVRLDNGVEKTEAVEVGILLSTPGSRALASDAVRRFVTAPKKASIEKFFAENGEEIRRMYLEAKN